MNGDNRFTDAQIEALCATGGQADLEATLDELIKRKQSIERQLALAKGDMLEVRSDLISKGYDHRSAQIQATGTLDHGWRAKAAAALKFTDGHIRMVKSRLKIVRNESQLLANQPALKPREKMQTIRKTVVFEGDAESVAEQLDEYIQKDWWVHASIVMPDGVIVVLRAEVPAPEVTGP